MFVSKMRWRTPRCIIWDVQRYCSMIFQHQWADWFIKKKRCCHCAKMYLPRGSPEARMCWRQKNQEVHSGQGYIGQPATGKKKKKTRQRDTFWKSALKEFNCNAKKSFKLYIHSTKVLKIFNVLKRSLLTKAAFIWLKKIIKPCHIVKYYYNLKQLFSMRIYIKV